MDLQHSKNTSLCLDRDKNLLNKIVDIDKYRALDDRYIITNICQNTDLKYKFNEDSCNIYYRSFSMSINFNKQLFKSIICFVDINAYELESENILINLFKDLLFNKNINMNVGYFKNCLCKISNGTVREIKDVKNDFNLYISKIENENREFMFIMMDNI